jgi:hypothetical protein
VACWRGNDSSNRVLYSPLDHAPSRCPAIGDDTWLATLTVPGSRVGKGAWATTAFPGPPQFVEIPPITSWFGLLRWFPSGARGRFPDGAWHVGYSGYTTHAIGARTRTHYAGMGLYNGLRLSGNPRSA